MRMTSAFFAFLLVFATPFSYAKTNPNINGLDLKQLEAVYTELDPAWRQIQALVNRTDDTEIETGLEAIEKLGQYEAIQENLDVLIQVLRSEAKRVEKGTANQAVMAAAVRALGATGTSQPTRYIEDLTDLQKELAARGAKPAMVDLVGEVIKHMEANSARSISLIDLMMAADKTENGAQARLAKMEEFLKGRVIGQPEAIDLILYMEFKRRFYGHSEAKEVAATPEAIYLMGLPGTGKDTIAEAWTDALYGYEGAYKTHMFRLPVMRTQADLWKVTGSATGYVGSEQFPPFIAWLVEHSGGKYKLKVTHNHRGDKTFAVEENPEYKGQTLEGYYPPESAIVFANEFHNWSREIKDVFLKQALEKGYFSINNPNGGLSEIYVPVRFVLASNEGIPLLTARQANGQRIGKPLGYKEIMEKWERVSPDKSLLRNEILSTNGSPNDPRTGGEAVGTSEELLNRVMERNLLILRPLSPEDLKGIANRELEKLRQKLIPESEFFKSVHLKWNDNVINFIQGYNYDAENNARPILGRMLTTVEEPLLKAVRTGEIKATNEAITFDIDIESNPDHTQSLVITVIHPDGTKSEVRQLIEETKKDRPNNPISDERIDELSKFAEKASEEVFGIDSIVERLGDRILSIANDLTSDDKARPINVLGVFGLTSTGKTELAKKTAKHVMGSEDDLFVLDFSQIQTLHDFQARILGIKDARGNPIASDFMKAYDRSNGVMVVALDEVANVKDPDLLRALYDFFREGVVTTFSDGKPRKMGGVFGIVTGNAGQEIFASVPNNIPPEVQMAAWKEIADRLSSDVNLQLEVLQKYLPWPLVARIGKNNIFFVPPHTYRSLRQLAQLKLKLALDRIGKNEGRRGWKITFPTNQEYAKFIDTVIEEGFSLRYQGASIDSYIRDDFEETIKSLLLKNKVPSGSSVVVKYREMTDNSKEDVPAFVIYDVYVDGSDRPLTLKLRRPYVDTPAEKSAVNQMLTAYHEAGHTLVRKALFGDKYKAEKISIIPGVAEINDAWVYYAGIATNSHQQEVRWTRDTVIREIAVLTAGETAERMVSKGQSHSIGKQNDMERASRIARDAILRFGLSDKWGTDSVPTGVDITAYIGSLSEARKQLLESEIKSFVQEGRNLAEQTIEMNYANAFLPLGATLGEKGVMYEDELAKFYADHPLSSPDNASAWARLTNGWKTKIRNMKARAGRTVDPALANWVPRPAKMANIEEIAREAQLEMYKSVPLPKDVPIATNASYEKALGGKDSCTRALTGAL